MRTLRSMLTASLAAVFLWPAGLTAQEEGDYLWRVLTVRAAPGMLDELIDLYGEQTAAHRTTGEGEVIRMRHSQGDQWDLMLMFPMGSFADYYAGERVRSREDAVGTSGRSGLELEEAIEAATSVREELFARGPGPDRVLPLYRDAGLFHIEMFVALHDRRAELLEQRRMENAYYRHLDRRPNLIFTREAGAGWDLFPLGFHPSLLAFAEAGAASTGAEQDAAARAAGFESVDTIGTYLRSLMLRHQDTLAGRVN